MADVVHNADGSWHRPPHPSVQSAGPSRSNAGLKMEGRRQVNMADYDAYTAVTAEMLGVDGQQIADDVLLIGEIPIDWSAKDDERAKRNTWSRRK